MGLINPDTHTFVNGVQKSDTYISFASEIVIVQQGTLLHSGDRMYYIHANYNTYWDKDARFAGRPHIEQSSVRASFSNLNANIYEILYDSLKSIFPNAYDSIDNTIQIVNIDNANNANADSNVDTVVA